MFVFDWVLLDRRQFDIILNGTDFRLWSAVKMQTSLSLAEKLIYRKLFSS